MDADRFTDGYQSDSQRFYQADNNRHQDIESQHRTVGESGMSRGQPESQSDFDGDSYDNASNSSRLGGHAGKGRSGEDAGFGANSVAFSSDPNKHTDGD